MPDEVNKIHRIRDTIKTQEDVQANYITSADKNERRRGLATEKRWATILRAVGSDLKCPICNRKVAKSNAWTLTTDPIQCRSCAQKGTRQHRTHDSMSEYIGTDCPYILDMRSIMCQIMLKGLRTKANISVASLSAKSGVGIGVIQIAERDGFVNLVDCAALLKALGFPIPKLTLTFK